MVSTLDTLLLAFLPGVEVPVPVGHLLAVDPALAVVFIAIEIKAKVSFYYFGA